MADLNEALEFLDSIEGAGYGGMAAYEAARSAVRLSTSPATSLPTREEIARVIDPHAFEDWQRKYDFELKLSGDDAEARKFADWSEKERINAALAKADRILALFAQPQEKKP